MIATDDEPRFTLLIYSRMATPITPRPGRPSAQRYDATLDTPERIKPIATDPEGPAAFVFGRQTFIWIGIGVALMALGMLLMAGGGMPSPEVWDDELIYSFRRITLAPIVIIAGLGVITYAIMRK